MPRRAGTAIAAAVAVVWLVVGVALVSSIAFEALTESDRRCRLGTADVYGQSEWQAWPPGVVCTYMGHQFNGPPDGRTRLIVAELVVGAGLVVLWLRWRKRPDPDWTA